MQGHPSQPVPAEVQQREAQAARDDVAAAINRHGHCIALDQTARSIARWADEEHALAPRFICRRYLGHCEPEARHSRKARASPGQVPGWANGHLPAECEVRSLGHVAVGQDARQAGTQNPQLLGRHFKSQPQLAPVESKGRSTCLAKPKG